MSLVWGCNWQPCTHLGAVPACCKGAAVAPKSNGRPQLQPLWQTLLAIPFGSASCSSVAAVAKVIICKGHEVVGGGPPGGAAAAVVRAGLEGGGHPRSSGVQRPLVHRAAAYKRGTYRP
jgi:hypothetical protein